MTKLEFEELQVKFRTGGKTLKAFLSVEGVAYSTYNYWSKKMRDEAVTLPIAPIALHESRDSHATEDAPVIYSAMGSTAMEHKAFNRILPNITCDRKLFPE